MSNTIISAVAALIRDPDGRVLLVRKRGTEAFMQPGGKREVGENDAAALSREIAEELSCRVRDASAHALGVFDCPAANEPGFSGQRYGLCRGCRRSDQTGGGIDQVVWIDPHALPDLPDARPRAAAGALTPIGGCIGALDD